MRSVVALCFVLASAALAEDPTVTVKLADYQNLTNKPPAITVIDTLLLGGSFHDSHLTIAFSGRSTGTPLAADVLTGAKELTISGCSGDAIVARSDKGAFSVLPLRDAFNVRCELRLSGSDRALLNVTPSVLGVRSTVSDGELIAKEQEDNGNRPYALVRQVTATGETLPVTATGRYLITLLPDTARFAYAIDVHNPNRTTASLTFRLASGEHLQKIDSTNQYEVRDGSYVFAIAPGDSAIATSGEMRGSAFAVPVEAALQYLVIESHPLLRAATSGATKRVSIAETGVRPAYRGALAYEIGRGERVAWSITRLEALHTLSYAVSGARHDFFIPADGPLLGESAYKIENQGASEAIMPVSPRPTYASLQDQTLMMTKSRDGRLTVPLSSGEQVLFVQHMQSFRRRLGVGIATIEVPQLPVAATDTLAGIGYAAEWVPLIERFATRTKVWAPESGTVFVAILFCLWCERVLAMLGARRRRFVVATLLALAGASSETMWSFVAFGLAALTLVALAPHAGARWQPKNILAAVSAGVVACIVAYYPRYEFRQQYESMVTSGSGGLASVSAPSYEALGYLSEMQRASNSMSIPAPRPGAPSNETYQGLPARFELPRASRRTTFGVELLRTNHPQRISIVMISTALLWWIRLVLLVFAAIVAWRERAAIALAWRTRIAPAAEALPAT